MIMTFERVAQFVHLVTPEQLVRAHKIFGPDNKAFYLVENSKGEVDDEGNIIEYEVRYGSEKGFSCTCTAGQDEDGPFSHCHNPSGLCWHVRAAVAAALEERGALKEQSRLNALQAAAPKKIAASERRDGRLNERRMTGINAILQAVQMARGEH
jgi:hypothetical protein